MAGSAVRAALAEAEEVLKRRVIGRMRLERTKQPQNKGTSTETLAA
ncbi:hypothetical protein [Streptomyces sp. NPDC055709]